MAREAQYTAFINYVEALHEADVRNDKLNSAVQDFTSTQRACITACDFSLQQLTIMLAQKLAESNYDADASAAMCAENENRENTALDYLHDIRQEFTEQYVIALDCY